VGGMAEVCLAIRRGPGGFEQELCLKRVLAAHSDNDDFQRMFLTEARLAARLRHANIVQVYDFGEVDGVYYLALELVDGTDLRKLIRDLGKKGKRIDPPLCAWIAHQVLSALSCVHNATEDGRPMGLVHRDLSPSNVLLSRHGEVKLADFGVAKATNSAATASNSVKGKPSYMPIEQLELDADPRSDLFALGVVLYEMSSGKRPFDGPSDVGTLRNIMRGTFVPLKEAAPETPDALCAVVHRLLEKDRDARYPSAEAVADAIVDLVPPPSARRKLAELVREVTAEAPPADEAKRSTQSGVRSTTPGKTPRREPIAETAVLDPVAPEPAKAAPLAAPPMTPGAERSSRVRTLAIATGVLIVLAIAAVAIVASSDPESDPVATTPPATTREEPAVAPPPVVVQGPAEVAPAREEPVADEPIAHAIEERAADTEDLSEREEARGTVRVAVIPYGRVWVDGRIAGTAPITLRLSPGSHRIQAGEAYPDSSTTVRVTAGRAHQVTLRRTQ
jgi:hypothetical protein